MLFMAKVISNPHLSLPKKKTTAAIILLIGNFSWCLAQHKTLPAVTGSIDQGFSTPRSTKQPGEKDASAREVLDAYLRTAVKRVSGSFCGVGLITMGAAPGAHSARLTLGPGKNQERLDFDSPAGSVSVRFRGAIGGIVQPDGTESRLPASAASAGLFITPDSLVDALNSRASTLQDDGVVEVGGTHYRQIIYTTPLLSSPSRSSLTPPLVFTLLFDPESGFLAKTVDSVVLNVSSHVGHLRVMTFSDYRQVVGGFRPFEISESRDGQPLWRLSLQSVDASCEHGSDYYSLSGDQK